ncbi:MAG: DegQ family serine endoprotease [Alphaproteobacteria bacterium]
MTEHPAGSGHQPWVGKARSAAVGFGLGATLALSPLVWAQSPAADTPSNAAPPLSHGAPTLPQQSFAPLVKRVLPAVVNISVTEQSGPEMMGYDGSDHGWRQFRGSPDQFRGSPFEDFMRRFFDHNDGDDGSGTPGPFSEGPGGGKRIALGSGFIIDPSGIVVTNNHVVAKSSKVEVVLQDNSRYPARVLGRDRRTDIAVLKINADKPLPYVKFGDSSAAQVGDWVIAVGNPFGLGGSVTTGIISARGRDIHSGQFDDYLQIDAPINRGNSGGPTFNANGEVIGINTAIYSPNGGSVGIGFAVPSNVAKHVVEQVERHGKVSRGWLGVQIQEVTPAIAASLGLGDEGGALVAAVTPNSPASRAGVKQGDVILSFNSSDLKQMRDLPRLVANAEPEAGASMTVWRNGQRKELNVTLGEMPENLQTASARGSEPGEEQGADALGMRFGALTPDLRRQMRIGRDVQGVVITGIERNSPAESFGVTRGDVLVSINQEPVSDPDDAAQKLRTIAKSPQKNALLLLNRNGTSRYVGVTLGKDAG